MSMWISKRKWEEMIKKIADLEAQVQSQQQNDTISFSRIQSPVPVYQATRGISPDNKKSVDQ